MSASNQVSLFIPYVFSDVDELKIRDVIENYEVLGTVSSVRLVNKKKSDGSNRTMAFIEMNKWNDTEYAQGRKSDILNGREYKINYEQYYNPNRDYPYWLVVENTKIKTVPPPPTLVRNVCTPIQRNTSSSSTDYDGDDVTTSLVDTSYVEKIEQDNMFLRNRVIELETKLMNMWSSSYTTPVSTSF